MNFLSCFKHQVHEQEVHEPEPLFNPTDLHHFTIWILLMLLSLFHYSLTSLTILLCLSLLTLLHKEHGLFLYFQPILIQEKF